MRRLLALGLGAALAAACTSADWPRHHPAPGALGPYSGAVLTEELCYVSGKIGERGGSFETEADTALTAVEQELLRAGLAWRDVVSVTVYLTDMDDYAAFNAIYARRLPAPYPARACIGVAALPGGARVELAVVARLRT